MKLKITFVVLAILFGLSAILNIVLSISSGSILSALLFAGMVQFFIAVCFIIGAVLRKTSKSHSLSFCTSCGVPAGNSNFCTNCGLRLRKG
jgi:hypothetical protein